MTFEWGAEIGRLVLIKQRLAEVDVEGLWPHAVPGVGASAEAIAAAEDRLGVQLDQQHRAFLEHADGWYGISQDTVILSTSELGVGVAWETATTLLQGFADTTATGAVLPIALSAGDRDVYVMRVAGHHVEPGVDWYSGYLVESYATFEEFFRSLAAANLKEIEDLQAGR